MSSFRIREIRESEGGHRDMLRQQVSSFSSWVEVDLDLVRRNVLEIRKWIPQFCKIAAVVKANAYGHGAVEIGKELIGCGIEVLAVAYVEEGIELRLSGIKQATPIYLLSSFTTEQIDDILRFNLTPSISNIEQARILVKEAYKRGERIKINVKVDTGLSRFGVDYDEAGPFLEELSKLENVEIEGIYTQFATAGEGDNEFLREQLSRFKKVLETAEKMGVKFRFKHAAGSDALACLPESYFNMVRSGLLPLGIYSLHQPKRDMDLKPVMSFKTRVVLLRKIRKGASVGYGRTYIAEKDTAIAVCSVGYSDGYPRILSNRAEVLIGHRRYPVAGEISLNAMMIEVGENSNVRIGDEVTLIGRYGHEEITVQELASKAETSVDEICMINPRVPRVYIKGGHRFLRNAIISKQNLTSVALG